MQRCTQHPNNVWALHGLVECLKRRGESEELSALQARLASGAGQGGRADHLILPVPDERAIRAELLSPDEFLALPPLSTVMVGG